MDEQHDIVIGQELAAARAADERRLAGDPPPSPLPAGRYDAAHGELGLFAIQPVPLDDALTRFVRRYRAAAPDERAHLRDGIGTDDAYTLLAFARRAAVFGMRRRDAATVADGLSACAAVPLERIDARDGLVAIALLHHAGQRCGVGAESLLREARELGEPTFGDHLDAFLARPASERELRDSWGHVEAAGPHGRGLLGWGFGPWAPSIDLASVVLSVAGALEGDEYAVDDPTLGSDLPAVWLGAARDPGLEPALARIRAGAVIHARLRAAVGDEPRTQQLTAWVVEAAHRDDARLLERLAQTPRTGDALLGLISGTVFVLLVARSVVVGVAAHETTARLARFEPALRAALPA